MKKTVLIIIPSLIIVLLIVAGCQTEEFAATDNTILPAETPAIAIKPLETTIWIPESTITKPEKLQAKRRHLIISLIRKGIFDRIEMPGILPHLWVGPTFLNRDFKTKNSFVEIVYAYYFDRLDRKQSEIWGDTVRIRDVFTGKDIGSYSFGNLGGPLKFN